MSKHMSKTWARSLIAYTGHGATLYVWGRGSVVFLTCVRSWDCRTPCRSRFFIHDALVVPSNRDLICAAA
jgi:hypothetical protein